MSSKRALDKNNKYDRQLRLWGDHGQSALESAKVCLINATATGTEILKNLILPGVGSFTIVDGNKVSGEDAGNNFFLCKDSIGKSRAQTATEYLSELNDDVSGHFVEESVERLLDSDPLFFNSFSIVIATNVSERVRLNLADVLWKEDIPMLICRCYGFIGYMRLVVREHTVVESHPDSAHEDLRLDKPFPGLISYCDSLDLTTMNKKDHSHTPWLVVLYKYLQQWKQEHDGEMPHNYQEKNQLKDLIRNGVLKSKEGVPEEEENFDEAVTQLNTALVPTRIHNKILHLFDDEACKCLHSESKPFWILTRAIKEFVENEGKGDLPLRGTIPDMTADSERYVELHNVYRQQAKEDVTIVTKHLHTLLENIGRVPVVITERDVKTFCRNAAFLRVLRTRSLAQEYDKDTFLTHEIAGYFEDEEQDEIVYYTLLRAVDKFYDEYNRYPGFYDHQVEADIRLVKSFVTKLLQDWGDAGCAIAIKDDYIYEICRYGASELHSIASFLGGAAAQEVIKIITGQFVPINNTFIYNGMKQTSVTVQL